MVLVQRIFILGWVLGAFLTNVDGMTSRSHRSNTERKAKSLVYIGGLIQNASILPAIQNAIRDINNNPKILPNHQINFIWAEVAGCDVNRGFQRYLDLVDILPRKLLLLNGLCSDIIQTIDRETKNSAGNPRMLQVSYANSDSAFESTLQSSLFRLLPAEVTFNAARSLLLQEIYKSGNDGGAIGIIYENTPSYLIPHQDQVKQILQQGILGQVGLESEGFEETASKEEVWSLLRRLKERNVSVILGNFNATRARQILCIAYKEKMYGDKYTWLLAGDYEPHWWYVDGDCFRHEMERVMDSMLRIDILPSSANSMEKKSPEQRYFHQTVKNSKYDGYAYDAIWIMANALHNVPYFYAKVSSENSQPNAHVDYIGNSTISFQNPIWDEALHKSLTSVSLVGVTGRVSFNSKQGRVGYSLLVKQFQALGSGYDEVDVGEFNSDSNTLNMAKYPHRMIRRRARVLSSKSDFEEQRHPQHNEHSTNYGGEEYGGASGSDSDAITKLLLFSSLAYALSY